MKFSIINNPDEDLREEAERQLQLQKEKYGKRYCPCALSHTDDWICMCKEFREQDYEGECHCGRYYKIKTNEK